MPNFEKHANMPLAIVAVVVTPLPLPLLLLNKTLQIVFFQGGGGGGGQQCCKYQDKWWLFLIKIQVACTTCNIYKLLCF